MKQFTLAMSLAAAALFALPSTTFAQDSKPAGERPQRPEGSFRMDPEARLKFMTEKFGLTADQQAKIKEIIEKNVPKFKELMDKGWANLTEADMTAMRDSMKAQAEEINAVLTPEQQAKMKEWRSAGRRGGKPAEPKPATE
jgi:Spy/CpxP family protein refolding chaperone